MTALVLGNFRRFIAINGALEVDLTGQVNAETARGRHIGLVGGQMDFIPHSPDETVNSSTLAAILV